MISTYERQSISSLVISAESERQNPDYPQGRKAWGWCVCMCAGVDPLLSYHTQQCSSSMLLHSLSSATMQGSSSMLHTAELLPSATTCTSRAPLLSYHTQQSSSSMPLHSAEFRNLHTAGGECESSPDICTADILSWAPTLELLCEQRVEISGHVRKYGLTHHSILVLAMRERMSLNGEESLCGHVGLNSCCACYGRYCALQVGCQSALPVTLHNTILCGPM
jgi:hypothetical protein